MELLKYREAWRYFRRMWHEPSCQQVWQF